MLYHHINVCPLLLQITFTFIGCIGKAIRIYTLVRHALWTSARMSNIVAFDILCYLWSWCPRIESLQIPLLQNCYIIFVFLSLRNSYSIYEFQWIIGRARIHYPSQLYGKQSDEDALFQYSVRYINATQNTLNHSW